MKTLTTTSAVIDELGGTSKVGSLTGRVPSAVSNWRKSIFPPDTYIVITDELREKNCRALPALWRMVAPRRSQQEAS